MKQEGYIELKCKQLEGLLLQKSNECSSLNRTIAALKDEIQSLYSLVDDLKEEAADDRAELEKERHLRIGYEEEIARLQRELLGKENQVEQLISDNTALQKKASEAQETERLLELSKQTNVDFESIARLLQMKMFAKNNDHTRYLNGDFDFDEQRVEELGFQGMMDQLNATLAEINGTDKPTEQPKLRTSGKKNKSKAKSDKPVRRRNVFTIPILQRMGIDTSNLPASAKIIHRKDKETGEDVWVVRVYGMFSASAYGEEYVIGRFNVPGEDPQCSRHPDTIVPGNPLLPSFARFYLDMKFHYNISESRILEMLHEMQAEIPQSSLNRWMHQIMACLRERLEQLMLEVIKKSIYTNNDETRILVRNLRCEETKAKYNVEYIHAALSVEKKLVVMLYGEGSRSHDIPQQMLFEGSDIRIFTADRAALYETVVKSIKEKYGIEIKRSACWFHARHYFVDAFISDTRMKIVIELMNYLFYIERESKSRHHTAEQRLAFRLRYSRKVVNTIMKMLERMQAESHLYGKMVMKAVNYVLDDKAAFQLFLTDGRIEMHNIAIERCFRHIANGRRNWLHTGSHKAAQNLAFMYSLYESCKMNNLNFGLYIEDILTRIMNGDEDNLAMLPCYYVPSCKEEKECA